jgi:hypothetical protein
MLYVYYGFMGVELDKKAPLPPTPTQPLALPPTPIFNPLRGLRSRPSGQLTINFPSEIPGRRLLGFPQCSPDLDCMTILRIPACSPDLDCMIGKNIKLCGADPSPCPFIIVCISETSRSLSLIHAVIVPKPRLPPPPPRPVVPTSSPGSSDLP